MPTPTLPQFAAPGTVPDLIADILEVTQGMQSLNNDMPLVADRLTFVRLYVHTDGDDYPNVKGILQGTRGGQVLGVVYGDNQPITAGADGGDRLEPGDSLYFGLPWSWFEEGTLHLNAFVYAGDPDAPFEHEPESDNNFIETSVEFEAGQSIPLSLVPIHLHEDYDGAQPEKLFTQQEPGFWPIVIGMLRYLPYPAVQLYAPPVDKIYCGLPAGEAGVYAELPVGEHGNCEFILDEPGWMQYVTVMMDLVDMLTDDPVPGVNYYGMVHPDFDPSMVFYLGDGTTKNFDGIALNGQAFGIMPGDPDPVVTWYIEGAHVLAHEIGHRVGLSHVSCSGTEGSPDEDFPWPNPNCAIANLNEEGFYGFDVLYEVLPPAGGPTVISNDPSVGAPNQGFPLMGYTWPKYIDAYHWCMTLQNMGVDCDPATTPQLADGGFERLAGSIQAALIPLGLPPARQPSGPYLLVSGTVQAQPLEASILQTIGLPEPPSDMDKDDAALDTETGFDVALLDADGAVLAAAPIFTSTINHEPVDPIAFLTELPLAPGAATLVIRYQGETVAERSFSSSAPSVQLLSPNGGEVFTGPFEIHWHGSDPDGEPLTYTLQYSPDAGETWQVVALGLTGDSYQVLSLYNLTGSDQGKIRVLASDGARSGTDESDGVFSVPNTPPMPALQSPAHLAVFPAGARVPLYGSATDREDGVLPPEALTWESNLDGFLGTGDRLEPSDLSPGYHVLTLTAEDDQGAIGQAQVGINIDSSLAHYAPGEDELSLASTILAAGPAWTAPPATPPLAALIALALVGVGVVAGLILMVPLVRSLLRR
jgi:hypothetical protein